jgi:hypothetical protein
MAFGAILLPTLAVGTALPAVGRTSPAALVRGALLGAGAATS